MKKLMLALLLLTSCATPRVYSFEVSNDRIAYADEDKEEGSCTGGSCSRVECWED
ncbi:hypothetical protein [Chlamydia abortus]|uniref:hypothetical protein n=1 Tax=Chlamydia abortus TaxID=83555 RepID=UPI0002DBEC66|nr:hypothetical protein [Chlamydia abortus]AUS59569.1 uncharacterized protein CHAB577_0148 [Chlamydia abortus]QRR31855.1 hypothetical protein JS522_00745 [Chlamydia abortus]SFV97960.1 Uncharacterised protein [Chlamydia abortus]SFV97961.1 Uncharacterised protein [Chlamydia abortus]SFV99782.1 Uncharacterised protein [Chlamydia abortus]